MANVIYLLPSAFHRWLQVAIIESAVHVCALQTQVPNTQKIQKTVEVPRVHFIDMDTVLIHVVLQRRFHKLRKRPSDGDVGSARKDPTAECGSCKL